MLTDTLNSYDYAQNPSLYGSLNPSLFSNSSQNPNAPLKTLVQQSIMNQVANPSQTNAAAQPHYSAFGLTENHLDKSDGDGYRKINDDGIKQLQSMVNNQSSGLIGQLKNSTPAPMPQFEGMAPMPPPISPKQAGTLADAAGMTGVGSALGGATTSGLGGLLAALL